ncbi:MAG: hypothetical protein IPK17_38250 [Chloroflexi bacterium]|uniref:hypothetical protein n=1 Tax=Candidatus Flexifilum breve TaxID=3140694 RepID=UPI003134CA46|nr:hypothetical protein [Chloroflexota bacterium]
MTASTSARQTIGDGNAVDGVAGLDSMDDGAIALLSLRLHKADFGGNGGIGVAPSTAAGQPHQLAPPPTSAASSQ